MFRPLVLALLLTCSLAQAQSKLLADMPLNYLEQTSLETQDQPLVIFLHGYGSNERDLFGIKDNLPANYTVLSVRGRLELDSGSYQWFHKRTGIAQYDGNSDDLKLSAQALTDFIQRVTEKYHTQPDKVFLVGFSQGAMMTYEVALRHPEVLRGMAALSGRLLPVVRTQVKTPSSYQSLSVFIAHGTADPQVPYTGASDAQAFLKSLSIEPRFHSYPGVGHTINGPEVTDLANWISTSLKP
ncbi:phospholipase [Pseudomonas agarici]|uniref:Phospholipase n=1 Tax=Pseudomonas agarici TaxID=46677 RepID=A0A0X1SZF6_PSEAA|nr:dienelactone hydrolase family protein [Pseudomonas agarici]AMB84929.1 phospholipase [Pseudomonas agarici]NWB93168.1 dienelactone hydrolase family protein [Pseudomonas agarici]NWC08458.1 dienelactone hydrolase family protein [Pseudomonas agarici]SEK67544.1 phospholipase/carboxylesterase [Pseudomonas agarici]